MNDFFLTETQAQVQLTLLGVTPETETRFNRLVREGLAGKGERGCLRDHTLQLMELVRECDGPVAKRLNQIEDESERYCNLLLFLFAGHDTTGHTLTWLLLSLCGSPTHYKRLQREVDAFWKNRTSVRYEDLKECKFLTRCLMETLRLWPAVANGTFRQLESDEWVEGNHQRVLLRRGTGVQIFNWSRHRDPSVWGEDALEFNPDRDFRGAENWNGCGFAAYNPASKRFSPFSFPPRDCLGKNFAQMEMRLIMLYLLRDFGFWTTDPKPNMGLNRATLGPRNQRDNRETPRKPSFNNPSGGCWFHVVRRKAKI